MPTIDYYFATHSAFAYLGSARLYQIAAAHGRTVRHLPYDLRRVQASTGHATTGALTDARKPYFFGREIERWSEYRDAPVVKHIPVHHGNDLTLSSGMVIAAIEQGHRVDKLVHAILTAHWRDDADFADANTLSAIATSVDLDPTPLLEHAMSADIQAIYQANTEQAIKQPVFGSPTYVVDGDMFYGQDRLELVDRALTTPFRSGANYW